MEYSLIIFFSASSHNLDLNLGVAPPNFANDYKKNDTMGGFSFQSQFNDIPEARKATVNSESFINVFICFLFRVR